MIRICVIVAVVGLSTPAALADRAEVATLQPGDTAVVCNAGSTFTNLRNAPSTTGSTIIAGLANKIAVDVQDVTINDAGFPYYRVYVRDSANDIVRVGYIYHQALQTTCGLPDNVEPLIRSLAEELQADNPDLRAMDIWGVNAGFDGTVLDLRYVDNLADISALQGLPLSVLDLSETDVFEVTPLSDMTSLRTLSLYKTRVRDIWPLAELKSLKSLNLYETPIYDTDALAGLAELSELYLSYSGVTDIAGIAGLTSLQVLSLTDTPVYDFTPVS
ncbi:MAG: hypothetical protein AAFQ09_09235, partial [Pseudomonadota bacterium]